MGFVDAWIDRLWRTWFEIIQKWQHSSHFSPTLASLHLHTHNASVDTTVLEDYPGEEQGRRIQACLSQHPVNLWELRELALRNGGLLNDKYRQQAWPLLVGLRPSSSFSTDLVADAPPLVPATNACLDAIPPLSSSNAGAHVDDDADASVDARQQNVASFQDLDLIKRDVGRSVVFRYEGEGEAAPSSPSKEDNTDDLVSTSTAKSIPTIVKDRLIQVLKLSLVVADKDDNDDDAAMAATAATTTMKTTFHYYQGLHDVAGVLLHHLDYQTDLACPILQRLRYSHLRDAMRDSFDSVTWVLRVVLLPLLQQVEPQVHYALVVTQVQVANLCLPWIITWFTHDIYNATLSGRLVDACLASHPLLPLYLAAALLTHPILKKDLLQVAEANPDDPTQLITKIKDLPKCIIAEDDSNWNKADRSPTGLVRIQELLEDALTILQRIPPRNLLSLVDPNDDIQAATMGVPLFSKQEVLDRAGEISLFKAPCSWCLANRSMMASDQQGERTEGEFVEESCEAQRERGATALLSYTRAKVASGVPLLQADANTSSNGMGSIQWGSRRLLPKRKRKSVLVYLQRRLFGKKLQ